MEYYNSHYKRVSIEVQDFSQKWVLNGTEHSFLKYISRCYFKNKTQDLVKAQWFYRGETKNGTATRDAIGLKTREFRTDLLLYVIENDLTEWQCDALFGFFKRRFRDVDAAIEEGKREFASATESSSTIGTIEFTD